MATICQHHVLSSMAALPADTRLRLLRTAGINPAIFNEPEHRIHSDQAARLYRNVMKELNDECMGFSSDKVRFGAFRALCELASRDLTVNELLVRAAGFYRIVNNSMRLDLATDGNTARLAIRLSDQSLDFTGFMTEFLLVIWHRVPSWFCGSPIPLREVWFKFSEPDHVDELKIMFRSELRFDQPLNALIFDADLLELPLQRSWEEIQGFLNSAPAGIMSIPGAEHTLERQVERLFDRPKGSAFPALTLADAAEELGISPQTLHRRLQDSGTSFQRIKDNVRRELAIRYLNHSRYSIDRISEITGFAESRSFTRAFKQWTGASPRQFRKSLLETST